MVKRVLRGCIRSALPFMIGFILVLSSVMIVVEATDPTTVRINPTGQTVSAGESIVVTVDCSPVQPVKAFELKLSFNPSILVATSVSEGSFFDGYNTFFNAGIIDNVAGTIVNIYDLIIGPGNVTGAGSFVTINFTAKSTSGTSSLTLWEVRVTNEIDYIGITVTSASITVIGSNPPTPNPPPNGPPISPPSSENNPPHAPLKPSGPTLIELGTSYMYSSAAFDPDGDQVRLRFDWGDGSLSEWTSFVDSNTSVSVAHAWENNSTITIRVIAQDENLSNSSWSEPLTVVVSGAVSGNLSPVAVFVLPLTILTNHTVVFNASGCVDPDGVIMSYQWDFGDGTQGTGKTPVHVYRSPGRYTVTLTVTDNSGLTNSVSQFVVVSEQAPGATTEVVAFSPSYLTILILACIIGALLGFIVVFRDPLRAMLFQGTSYPSQSIVSSDNGVAEIEQILDSLFLEMENNASPLSKDTLLGAYCDVIIENVEANAHVHLPGLSIADVERIVDERFHSKIGEKIDKM